MIDTNNLIVNFGKHNGELWTRVPLDYLQWLVNQKETIKGINWENEKSKEKIDFDFYDERVFKLTKHGKICLN